jgi:hypothetical protein
MNPMTPLRRAPILALCLAALLAPAGAGPATGVLETLDAALGERLVQLPVDAPKAQRNALFKARGETLLGADTLADELAVASRVVRMLEKPFRDDGAMGPLLDGTLDVLEEPVRFDRDTLAAAEGTLPGAREERILAAAVTKADRALAKAEEGARPVRAKQLRVACKAVAKAAGRLEIPLPGSPEAPKPDFSLADVNPNSATSGEQVSPRDYLGKVSAWYFGHAT